jgi:hypothetical protein
MGKLFSRFGGVAAEAVQSNRSRRSHMLGKITLAAGLIALGSALAPASAAPALPQSKPTAGVDGLVQLVHRRHRHVHLHVFRRHHRHRFGHIIVLGGFHGGYCRTWRYHCAARWGWHTRGYYRCLWRHGC